MNGVALNVESQDGLRGGEGILSCGGNLDSTGFASTTGLDLGLHDGETAELLGRCFRILRSVGDEAC